MLKPIFEPFAPGRAVFDAPGSAPSSTPEEAPDPEPEKPKALPKTSQKTPEKKKESSETTAELSSMSDEVGKPKVLESWKEKGVGNKEELGDQDQYEKMIEAGKADPGLFVLAMLLSDGELDKVREKYYDSTLGKFKEQEITDELDYKKGQNEYGFYWNGETWCEVDAYYEDFDRGRDFAKAWPVIVNFHADAGYNELESGNVLKMQDMIKKVSSYFALIGADLTYTDGKDVVDAGLTDQNTRISTASSQVVDALKTKKGWTSLRNIDTWSGNKQLFLTSELEKYRYFKDGDTLVAAGIAGSDKAGEVRTLNVSGDKVDLRTGWTVVAEADKASYLEKAYDSMDRKGKMAAHISVFKNAEEGATGFEYLMEEIGKDLNIVVPEINLADKTASRSAVEAKVKSALDTKLKGAGITLTDAQKNEIVKKRTEEIFVAFEDKLKAKYPDADLESGKYRVTMSGGIVTDVKATVLTKTKEGAEKALDAATTAFADKWANAFGSKEAAADFYDGFKDKGPLAKAFAPILAAFIGPLMKMFKKKAGEFTEQFEKTAGSMSGTTKSKEVANLTAGIEPGKSKKLPDNYKLTGDFVLDRDVKVTAITAPRSISVKVAGMFGGETTTSLSEGRTEKPYTLKKGTQLPKDTVLEGVEVLPKTT
ncbi:MAG: hypothetical protein ABH856_02850 [Patescibacteria group bacterium]